MCGIAGILRFDGASPELEPLLAMNRSLVHRGPDQWGVERLGPCGLAHRRLSIIDLSEAGRQPMASADGALWLSYNGEIYNYLELRAELEKRGHTFRTHTDSEVLLAAYRQWGDDAFPRFNGMWALAIYDRAAEKLVLSRDRLGVKPLHLHKDGRRLLFASEAKALLTADPALARLDLVTVARFLEQPGEVYGRDTFFEGIERLEPGTVLTTYANGRSRSQSYWRFRPPAEPRSISLDEAAEEVRGLLADAVRLRFRSDVPVGTCLSGGLDSSSIVAISAKDLGRGPDTFSVLYRAPGFDESPFVDIVRRELGLTGHEIYPDGADLDQVLARLTYFQEQPTAGPGLYSQWQVMKLAAGRVRVLLDGQGGDELFGGYHVLFLAYGRALADRAARGDVRALMELIGAELPIRRQAKLSPIGDLTRDLRARVREKLGRPTPPPPTRKRPIAREHLLRLTAGPSRGETPPVADPLTEAMWEMLVKSSIPSLLHYEDRSSMAFSIEARVPFLDYRLVELAFQLPAALKIRGGDTKVVLREAMKRHLPASILERRDKKGYPTPSSAWMRGAHREWLADLLLSERVLARGFTEPEVVRALWSEHAGGASDHSWRIWQLATLELFCRRFLDGRLELEAPPSGAVLEGPAPSPASSAEAAGAP